MSINLTRCYACGRDLVQVWSEVRVPGGGRTKYAPVCSDKCGADAAAGERADIACEHCGSDTEPTDRLPTNAGGVCHQECALKVTLALGLEKSSLLITRRMGALRGGRS